MVSEKTCVGTCPIDPDMVQEMHDSVLRIEGQLGRGEDHMRNTDSAVAALKSAIDGNGKPGLKARMQDIEGFVALQRRIGWVVLSAVIGQLVVGGGGLLAAVVYLLRKGP